MGRYLARCALALVTAACIASCGDSADPKDDEDSKGDRGSAAGDSGADAETGSDGGGDDSRDADVTSQPGDSDAGSQPDDASVGVGDVPPELVGIWQQTRASAGEYMNGYGENFTITSGFSVQLKINEKGEYYLAHLASGKSNTCGVVDYFDQSVGTATLDGTTLILQPQERTLEVVDCVSSGVRQLATDPMVFTVGLEESEHYYGGLRTYVLNVSGGPHTFELTLLHREPSYTPVEAAQAADFVLGVDPPYNELQGLWVAADGTDANFYDPATSAFSFPELNGSPHQWLRFDGTGYEAAVALQNTNSEGACKSDVIYYEQGSALFGNLEDVSGQGSHFVGHTRFEATRADLIVSIRDCNQDDEVFGYSVTPLKSYFRFIYFSTAAPPERLTLQCNYFAQSEWQSLLCTDPQRSFSRRE
jgi:hypothetical protein